MIKLENVTKSFGTIPALQGVSFEIKPGAITILAGADGAGKSTIFKFMVGLVHADGGQLVLEDRPLDKYHSRLTAMSGYMPERFSLYTDLSVEENLNFFADIQGVPHDRREELKHRLLAKTGMLPFRTRKAGALSGGMKQKLALSAILLSSPRLIILDEPTTGVDPLSRIEFFTIIEELKREGRTIVMSTPYLDEAEKGDHIVFIKNGRIIQEAAIGDLRRDFPARLFRILPEGNIFDCMNRLLLDPEIGPLVYMKGRFIRYLQSGPKNLLNRIPHREVTEEAPALEDIYIYYERLVS